MKRIIICIFGAFVLVSLLGNQLAAQEYKVIVNKSSSVTTLTKDQVSKLFLKKITRFSNGNMAYPVDLFAESFIRKKFSEEILGQSISSVRKYWQKQIFSGRGVPPPEKTNDSEVLAFVQENPGAIGYVSGRTNTSDVKVVTIID